MPEAQETTLRETVHEFQTSTSGMSLAGACLCLCMVGAIGVGAHIKAGLWAQSAPDIAYRINIHSASREELQALPQVGPVLAERIYREAQRQTFLNEQEMIDHVPGLGPMTMAEIRPYIEPINNLQP